MKRKRPSVTVMISLIIITGFFLSALSYVISFNVLFRQDIKAVSELTSENIYLSINSIMDRPINVSTAMSHDTFLRTFMKKEGDNVLQSDRLDTLKAYLSSYQQKYQFDSVFLISANTGAYYHYQNGLDRIMTTDNSENEWYYDFLKDPSDCSLNVDNDEAKDNGITIFVNCKLYDENHNLLGIVGVGLETPYIQEVLIENEQAYGIHAFLIDVSGNIQLSSDLTEFENVNLFNAPQYQAMKEAIKLNTSTAEQRWYHSSGLDGYVITKYVPHLNWYLVVEKNTENFQIKMLSLLSMSIVFLALIVFIIIKIITNIIKKYNQKLTDLAELDLLTGIGNRTSYEQAISQCEAKFSEYQSFGIGVFDLNNLKFVNDQYGHQMGDICLKSFAKMLCTTFSHCPVFRIGGDEFAVIFENLSAEQVLGYWKELQQLLSNAGTTGGLVIKTAFGYSFRDAGELNTVEKIFKDADDKMYLDKKRFKAER